MLLTSFAEDFLELSPVDTEAAADRMHSDIQFGIVKELEDLAAAAAWKAAYLEMRYGSGCGDQGHADAVKAANKARAKVRKAFGYSKTLDIRV